MADVDNRANHGYYGLQNFIPPFVTSYAMLVMMFLVQSRLIAEPVHMAYFFLLCYMGGIAAVAACRSAIVFRRHPTHPILEGIVSHMELERTRYLAALVIAIVLYQEWNNPEHHHKLTNDIAFRSCGTMLVLGFVVQYLGELVGGQLMRGRNAGIGAGHPGGNVEPHPDRPRWWKILWELAITTGVFSLGIATTVVSGTTAWPLGFSIAGGALSAMKEAAPSAMDAGRHIRRLITGHRPAYPPVPPDLAERIFVQLRMVPMYLVRSPVVMPATGLLITYTRVCYWPKPSTQWFTFLLRVAEITVCVMHIGRSPVPVPGGAPAGNDSWHQKATTGLLSFGGWVCLLCCACILEPGPFGGALVMIAVSIVALDTPHEKVWRGCILLFWTALFCVILSAPINEVIQARKVYKAYRAALHIFDGGDGNRFDMGKFLSAVREVPKDWSFGEMALCPVGTAKPRR